MTLLREKPQRDLVDLEKFDASFKLDIRYATKNNFVGRAVYPLAKAFLQKPVAESLKKANADLRAEGYGILIFDGYRPWSVTKLFWDVSDENARRFLANPERGSIHNRGCAVDCSMYELSTGREVRMPSEFDEMNERAYADFTGGTAEERRRRDLLIHTMEKYGFKVLKNEWWHFNHSAGADYPILDLSFHEVRDLLR